MSLQKMDMNTVMYPEISGESSRKERRKNGNDSEMEMDDQYGSLQCIP
jgi:hypothetical protein